VLLVFCCVIIVGICLVSDLKKQPALELVSPGTTFDEVQSILPNNSIGLPDRTLLSPMDTEKPFCQRHVKRTGISGAPSRIKATPTYQQPFALSYSYSGATGSTPGRMHDVRVTLANGEG
jgi:hypothetical protein